MKKIFFAVGLLLAVDFATFANEKVNPGETKEQRMERRETRREFRKARRAAKRSEVSSIVKTRFAEDFPDATSPVFYKTKDFDEVAFMSGKKMMKAYYDISNELVGTTQKKTLADIPESAQLQILKHYPGYNVVAVIKYDDNEDNDTDMILFDRTFEDMDNYFVEVKNDKNDKILKVSLAGDISFFADMK